MFYSVVCGFQYKYTPDGSEEISHAFPIAGLDPLGHGSKDAEVTRLKGDEQEGLLVKLAGGEYIDKDKKKKDARAVIEFQCDPDRSGLEGLSSVEEEEEEEETRRRLVVREDEGDKNKEKDKEKTDPNDGSDPSRSLQFESFGPADDDAYVLKLKWRTRYACDNYVRDRKGDGSSHWGFFTWLIIMYVHLSASHQSKASANNLQPLPLRRRVPYFRLLAQLQPLRCPWLGPPPARRHPP